MKYFFASIISTVFFSSCISVGFHDYAKTDYEEAERLIKVLKNDTLLVAYPTYQEQERILRSAIVMYPEKRAKLEKELIALILMRNIDAESISNAFIKNYKFSQYLLIPDSLIHDFEEGKEGAFFINDKFKLDSNIKYKNKNPIKFISKRKREWDLIIGEELLPNPLPNHMYYRGDLQELLGIEIFDTAIHRLVNIIDRRLNLFYSNPKQKVYL